LRRTATGLDCAGYPAELMWEIQNMKTRIMIVEDNYYKYFTMRQLIESQLKIKVEVVTARSEDELANSAEQVSPTILIVRPRGGIVELLSFLKERNVNCRNSVVTIVVVPEGAEHDVSHLEKAANRKCSSIPIAA
jgi:chemotaxis response regulator CheB